MHSKLVEGWFRQHYPNDSGWRLPEPQCPWCGKKPRPTDPPKEILAHIRFTCPKLPASER
jgi:hypothetical protein